MFGPINLTKEAVVVGDVLKLMSIGPHDSLRFVLARSAKLRVEADVPPGTKLRFLSRHGSPAVTAVRLKNDFLGIEFDGAEKTRRSLHALNRPFSARFEITELPPAKEPAAKAKPITWTKTGGESLPDDETG